ncbi:MAG TPA: FtsK/SpoIIIE domain-containing protein, partial [Solirubrobacter sp.]
GAPPGLRWREMEVVAGGNGAPTLRLHGAAARAAAARGVATVHVSLTHAGGVAAAVVVLALVATVLATPGMWRRLDGALLAARIRRAWWRAWTDCELPRVRAGKVSSVPAGELVRVRASRGSSLEFVERRAEELAVCLQAREVRVARDRDNAATGTVTLVRRDPLAQLASVPWPHREAWQLSLWDPVPVGVDELGDTVTISLPERNVLVGGEPGAGKSVALSLLVATAALDPDVRLWLLDGKLVELSAWAPCAQRLAGPDVDEAIAVLRELRTEMDARYRELLARGKRKVTFEDGLPLHLLVCDELAFYLGVEDRKQQREFAELLRDLVARGRAAGVIVCAATQKPASDVVPTALRDLFGFRLALRCNTPQASDTILGQGWAGAGHSAASIAPGERGIGLLLAEDGTPVRLKSFHLTDADVDDLAMRAAAARADSWLDAR